MRQGWLTYYNKSSGPKFTEEQIQMANSDTATLEHCFYIYDFLNPISHSKVCKKHSKQFNT